MLVPEVIAAYHQAIAADDRALARHWLEKLEGEAYRNEADWALIRPFFQKEGLHGRLELITSALIRTGAAESGEPYFVLAGLYLRSHRPDAALPLIAQYRQRKPAEPSQGTGAEAWAFANLLYEARLFEECLVEIQAMLNVKPEDFGYRMLEAQTLGKMRDSKSGLKRLKAVKSSLGRDAGRWQWFASVAFNLGDDVLGQAATRRLIELIESGEGKLNYNTAWLMKQHGYTAELSRLVFNADTKFYKWRDDLTYVFDLALEFGAGKTAARFGNAILALDPDKRLRSRIERFLAEPGFLMA